MKITWRYAFYGWETATASNSAFPFSKTEYIGFNLGIKFKRYDPLVIQQNPPLVGKSMDSVFPGYTLYQFPRISAFRPFPLRMFYSKVYGNFYELAGSAAPINEMMRYLKSTDTFQNDGLYDPDKIMLWVQQNLYKFILCYFDNVIINDCRNEVINILSGITSPTVQLINRIWIHYSLQPNPRKDRSEVEQVYNRICAALDIPFEEKTIKTAVGKAVAKFMKDIKGNLKTEATDGLYSVGLLPVIISGKLQLAEVSCNLSDNNEGFGGITTIIKQRMVVKFCKMNNQLRAEIVGKVPDDQENDHLSTEKMPFFL